MTGNFHPVMPGHAGIQGNRIKFQCKFGLWILFGVRELAPAFIGQLLTHITESGGKPPQSRSLQYFIKSNFSLFS